MLGEGTVLRSYSWEFNLLCLDSMESVVGQGHGALVDQSQALHLREESSPIRLRTGVQNGLHSQKWEEMSKAAPAASSRTLSQLEGEPFHQDS